MTPATTPGAIPADGPADGRAGEESLRGADEVLVGFARALRAAGVRVTQDRTQSYLRAVALVGLDDEGATYEAGRATLCSSPDDLDRYDEVHHAYFNASHGLPRERRSQAVTPTFSDFPLTHDGGASGEEEQEVEDVVRARASDADLLRERDVAGLSAAEKLRIDALVGSLAPRLPLRRVARHDPWRRGRVDASRTLRASLRRMGEPAPVHWRRRARRPRRVLLLVDVSGSMSGYAEVLLRVAHRLSQVRSRGGRVETYTVGTRLTRITRAMAVHDVERALVAAGRTVPDWSGGTRLGETLRTFLEGSGHRGAARGAVVVVFSDGWERGDPALLAEQVQRLGHLSHRLVWVNPHRGKAGYEPVQQGMMSVLPYVDDFVAGHSLATYGELLEVIAHA